MDQGIDPAKKQYYMFSLVIALAVSILLNFVFIGLLKGSLLYGFPIGLGEASGFSAFFIKLLNTLIYTAILSVPVYFGIMWLINRRTY